MRSDDWPRLTVHKRSITGGRTASPHRDDTRLAPANGYRGIERLVRSSRDRAPSARMRCRRRRCTHSSCTETTAAPGRQNVSLWGGTHGMSCVRSVTRRARKTPGLDGLDTAPFRPRAATPSAREKCMCILRGGFPCTVPGLDSGRRVSISIPVQVERCGSVVTTLPSR